MKTLDEIGIKQGTDKSSLGHNYLNIYEKFFSKTRGSEIVLLEIGVQNGNSMKTWEKFFYNPKTRFYGIDINKDCKYKNRRTRTFIGRQENRLFLENVISSIKKMPDIIIDDGGHMMEQQQVSLGYLFQHLKPGGIYIIEDLETSKKTRFNPNNTTTTLEILKNICDGNDFYSKFMLDDEATYLKQSIDQCLLYNNSVCVITKRKLQNV